MRNGKNGGEPRCRRWTARGKRVASTNGATELRRRNGYRSPTMGGAPIETPSLHTNHRVPSCRPMTIARQSIDPRATGASGVSMTICSSESAVTAGRHLRFCRFFLGHRVSTRITTLNADSGWIYPLLCSFFPLFLINSTARARAAGDGSHGRRTDDD